MSIATETASLNTTQLEVGREWALTEQIVFVGGQGGCGKSMLTPIIGSLDRVEIQKYNYPLEHICTLNLLGKLSPDVVKTMVRMLTDLDLYNMMMSRETNFRFEDLSSIWKNPRPTRYLKRLVQPGNEAVVGRLKAEKPILHTLIHDLLARCEALFVGVGQKATIVEMVRHPLYMIKQWMVNIQQFYTEQTERPDLPREFSIWIRHRGQLIPWFTYGGMEDLFIDCKNPMDKAIYLMDHHIRRSGKTYQRLTSEQKKRVLFIPFEPFVIDPWPYLNDLSRMLGSQPTAETRKELKRQNIPRKMIAEGIGLPIYKKYGWAPPKKGGTERDELNKRREFAAQSASPEALKVLDRISAEYEDQWMKGFDLR